MFSIGSSNWGPLMALDDLFEKKMATEYNALSQQLRVAADFVLANPVDVATRSLRSISTSSGLAPATFSRLARALGFETYESLREVARDAIHQKVSTFSAKAGELQEREQSGEHAPFFVRQSKACIANIAALAGVIDAQMLETAVERMHKAKTVLLLGALGSTGIVEYMSYLTNFYTNKFRFASCLGASIGSIMADINEQDAILIVTKPPFAKQAIQAAEMAKSQGVFVTVITDTPKCPALAFADASFIVSTESPQFFSSYAATIVLIESIIGMLVARAGPAAQTRISEVEARNHRLDELWGH